MLSWRLCREAFSDLTGAGARRYGGTWNSPGRPVVYVASTAALAVLEIRVHLDLPFEFLPDDFVLLTIDLGGAAVEIVASMPSDSRSFGDVWLREQRTPVLQLPSTIVPESSNLLINPAHAAAADTTIGRQRRFAFDRRLWFPA